MWHQITMENPHSITHRVEQCRVELNSQYDNELEESRSLLANFSKLNNLQQQNYFATILNANEYAMFKNFSYEIREGHVNRFLEEVRHEEQMLTVVINICSAIHTLWWILAPIILLVGSIGNLTAIWVLYRYSMYKLSTYTYMVILAVMDELVLITCLLRRWLDLLLKKRMEDSSYLKCILTQIVGFTASNTSVWLVVILTAERLLVVTWPLKASRYTRPRIAVKVFFILLSIIFLINSHLVFNLTLKKWNQTDIETGQIVVQSRCTFKSQKIREWWLWMDFITYSLLPFLILIICNSVTIKNIIIAHRKRQFLISMPHSEWARNDNSSDEIDILVAHKALIRTASACSSTQTNTSSSITPARRPKSSSDSVIQVTLMLISVSVCFLVTTLPVVIIKIYTWIYFKSSLVYPSRDKIAQLELWDGMGELLMYLNHALNCYLYCASGSKFRQEMIKTIGSYNKHATCNYTSHFVDSTKLSRNNLISCRKKTEYENVYLDDHENSMEMHHLQTCTEDEEEHSSINIT